MMLEKHDVLKAAMALSPGARAEVAGELFDSLVPIDPDIEKAWAAEAVSRFEAFERGEMAAIDGDVVFDGMDFGGRPL